MEFNMNLTIVDKLKDHKKELQEKYFIKKIGIFGSYVRGEEKADSDIDILVEFEKDRTPGFFKFLDLEDELEKLFNKKIDLVTNNALKDVIKDSILQEVFYI